MAGSETGSRPRDEEDTTFSAMDPLAPAVLGPRIARRLGMDPEEVENLVALLAEGLHPVYLVRHRPDRIGGASLAEVEGVASEAAREAGVELRRQALAREIDAAGLMCERLASLLRESRELADFEDLREAMRRRRHGMTRAAAAAGLEGLAAHLWRRGARLGPPVRRRGSEAAGGVSPAEGKSRGGPVPSGRPGEAAEPGEAVDGAADPAPTFGVQRDLASVEAGAGGPAESLRDPAGGDGRDPPWDEVVARYVRGKVADANAALEGARALCVDDLLRIPELRRHLRRHLLEQGIVRVVPRPFSDGAHVSGNSAEAPQPPVAVPSTQPSKDDDGAPGTEAPREDVVHGKPDGPAHAPSMTETAGGLDPGATGRGEVAAKEERGPTQVPRDGPSPSGTGARETTGAAEEPPPTEAGRKNAARRKAAQKARARREARLSQMRSDGLVERPLPVAKLDPGTVLAIWHGVRTNLVRVEVPLDDRDALVDLAVETLGIDMDSDEGRLLAEAVREGLAGSLGRAIASGVRRTLKARADQAVAARCAAALRRLLLAPAAGAVPVLAIVPGHRRGCTVVVVDGSGSPLADDVIHPLKPKLQVPQAKARVVELVREYGVRAVAVAAGPEGREVVRMCRTAVREMEGQGDRPIVVEVPEDAAQLWASSKAAKQLLPGRPPPYRRALALARRLQDPLAELARVDPRHLGLGPHQQDVDPKVLGDALAGALSAAVHVSGLDPNTADADLLAKVSGVGHALAGALVAHRTSHGTFRTRSQMLDVPGMPGRSFVLSAGFLWLPEGEHPLDRTFIHPEWYGLVAELARAAGHALVDVVGRPDRVADLEAKVEGFYGRTSASGEKLGPHTVARILAELRCPRGDGRPRLWDVYVEPPVRSFDEVQPGQELDGVITHVASFGAFVDLGLPSDALLHVSELSDGYVEDPLAEVFVGQAVRVRILSMDPSRGRVAVTRRLARTEGTKQRGTASRGAEDGGRKRRGGRNADEGGRKRRRQREGDRKRTARGRKGPRGGTGRGRRHRDEDRPLNFRMDLSALAAVWKDDDAGKGGGRDDG